MHHGQVAFNLLLFAIVSVNDMSEYAWSASRFAAHLKAATAIFSDAELTEPMGYRNHYSDYELLECLLRGTFARAFGMRSADIGLRCGGVLAASRWR